MPRLTIQFDADELVYELNDETNVTLGRLEDNQVQIDHPSVSSHHAEFILQGNAYLLRDLQSTNGTRVNGDQVSEVILRGGERIRFGKVEAFYSSGEGNEDLKPLPEQKSTSVEIGSGSGRPDDFKSTSPFQRRHKKKDPLDIVVIAAALIAAAALAVVVLNILTLAPPPPIN